MQAELERLIVERPSFHAWPDGTPANWSVEPRVLRFIAAHVKPGMSTLETGAGQTTVGFALAGAHHICITPDQAEVDRIRAYLDGCAERPDVRFVLESSDKALPAAKCLPDRLDFVFIDGAHRFPFPILDWYFTESRVPVGGIVAVDDYRMPSVRVLYDFLAGEEEWQPVETYEVTAFFRRMKRTENVSDWADQAMNREHFQMVRAKMERAAEPAPRVGPVSQFLDWTRSIRRS
jgi:predicted O-methyltransferase YrrM